MKKTFIVIVCMFFLLKGFSQSDTDKMRWWKEAKFGMFIHWGVYSVPGGIYNGKENRSVGEWIMNKEKIPVGEYKEYAKQFNPTKYDPESWVKLAKEAGMKYIVITSKHHDGFALFDTKASDWDIVDATPYGKDLLKPLVEACRREGIKIGFYYSQAQDWVHPGGAAHGGHWDKAQDGPMDQYLKNIAVPQVKEILSNYGAIDILWWDTPGDMTKERADMFQPIIGKYPTLITNDRLGGGYQGDMETPEQTVPETGFPGRYWETCMTMNDTWGYKSTDHNWKSTGTIIHKLVEIISKGGNYLLNVGPDSQGLIPQSSIDRLKAVGEWIKTNGESIYGADASPFHYLPWGRCTQKGNKLYLHIFDWPENGKLSVPLFNSVKKAYLLSNPEQTFKVKKSKGKNTIQLTGSAPDSIASVVVAEIDGAPQVLPIPTEGKSCKASSTKEGTDAADLFDGEPKSKFIESKWQPEDGDPEKWVEVDLGENMKIGAYSLAEPWAPWSRKSQTIEIQYKKNNKWHTADRVVTKGTGVTQAMKPVTARYFRVKTVKSDDIPTLNEWILYRAE